MEDMEFLLLLIALWFAVTWNTRRQRQLREIWLWARWLQKRLREKRLREVRQIILEKESQMLAAIQEYESEHERIRRRHSKTKVKYWNCVVLGVLGHSTEPLEWWNVIVPSFTNAQWVENFSMSEETFNYLCIKLRPAMEVKDNTFRRYVPLMNRVAIALWKLATGSE